MQLIALDLNNAAIAKRMLTIARISLKCDRTGHRDIRGTQLDICYKGVRQETPISATMPTQENILIGFLRFQAERGFDCEKRPPHLGSGASRKSLENTRTAPGGRAFAGG